MPLTKVRYDMLDPEVTTKIKAAVTLSGAGSPFVFTPDGSKETLTQFKIDGENKDIREASFVNKLLVIELASFSPTNVSATGQTLSWDQPATGFSVAATNPADYPLEYLSTIKWPITAGAGSVELNQAGYTNNQTGGFPLSATGDIAALFTLASGKYIRPTITDTAGVWPATGGTASATVTFIKHTATTDADYLSDPPVAPAITYTWTTNWASVSHGVSLAALSNKCFLKTYDSTTWTITTSGLSDPTKANCTLTPTGGSVTSPGETGTRSGTFSFSTNQVNKSNVGTTRKLNLSTVFKRPSTVTGTEYTHTPTAVDTSPTTVTASFVYPSFTIWSDAAPVGGADNAKPTLATIMDDSEPTYGFNATNVTRLAHQAYTLSTSITNTDQSNARRFWFAVRKSTTQPNTFKAGEPLANVTYESFDLGLRPANISDTTKWTGYVAEDYTFYGITVPAGASTNVVYSRV
jgi:hypothetical protein